MPSDFELDTDQALATPTLKVTPETEIVPEPAPAPLTPMATRSNQIETIFKSNWQQALAYVPNANFVLWFKPTIIKLMAVTALTPLIIVGIILTGIFGYLIEPLLRAAMHSMEYSFLHPADPGTSEIIATINRFQGMILTVIGCASAFATYKLLTLPNEIIWSNDWIIIGKASRNNDEIIDFSTHRTLVLADVVDIAVIRPPSTKSSLDYKIEFRFKDGKTFSLRYGDVIKADDRHKLLQHLINRFPNYISSQDLEPLRPASDELSYTALWLKELAAPPKRDKLAPLATGALVNNGRYAIISRIGVGGQGTVYLARDERKFHGDLEQSLSSEVVLKEFLLPVYPEASVRKAAALRFQDEAALLGRLDHPKIVRFLELFLEDHRAYLVLEKIDGTNLRDLVSQQGPFPILTCVNYMEQMARILQYLHGQTPPVVHRDFTPDNLILLADGTIKLIDFSVAQVIDSTVTGSVVGKPNFISPEQFRGKAQPASDIYSLGATAYYMIEGRLPEPITNLRLEDTSDRVRSKVSQIIERATRLDTASRYQDVSHLLADIAKLRELM